MAALLIMSPGPNWVLIAKTVPTSGKAAGFANIAGFAVAFFVHWAFAIFGLSVLLLQSANLFLLVKLAGAAYLIWLGIKLFRAGGTLDAKPREDAAPGWKMLGHAWLVTALNPKSITFFVAFLPQFLDTKGDFWTQMLIFEATFVTLAFANAMGYALIASRARAVVSNPRAIGLFNKAGGTLLIGAGVATVAIRSGSN